MSTLRLQERAAAIEEIIAELRNLCQRLCSLAQHEDSTEDELIADHAQKMRKLHEEIDLLAADLDLNHLSGHDGARARENVERFWADMARCRSEFRKARLVAKKKAEDAQRAQRELRIKSFSVSAPVPADETPTATSPTARAPLHRNLRTFHTLDQTSLSEKDRQAVGASGNVTDALRRTHDLMATELARSDFARQTLEESSAALEHLGESYSSLDTMLASSRDLLGTLLRSEKSDTWYLQTAFYVLLVTGAWLVYRRLLYGPIWWLVWLPLRIVFGMGAKIGGVVVQRGGGGGEKVQMGIGREATATVAGLPDEELPTVEVKSETWAIEDEIPTFEAVDELPIMEDVDELPIIEDVDELPSIEDVDELPIIEKMDELPVIEEMDEPPVIEARDELPIIAGRDEL
ncbi:hypothetical protein CDD81_2115 [Ophiocordyceps australis]|uniref:Sec20 C-terminal domain-containing protein n=1 Tax=Ophiocordyceps australis TaxID=1399860 RepID=A0A2C5XXJ4_9HYPO|nr:hypothetical protein CDD81_2115 [Ophiocordyceps australis]